MRGRHVHQRLSCGRSIQSLDAKEIVGKVPVSAFLREELSVSSHRIDSDQTSQFHGQCVAGLLFALFAWGAYLGAAAWANHHKTGWKDFLIPIALLSAAAVWHFVAAYLIHRNRRISWFIRFAPAPALAAIFAISILIAWHRIG
jgi:hypothetical protein